MERDGDRVRLITRGGYDWTKRYPWIVEAARRNHIKPFVLDGEAVVLCLDGMPDFNALHSRKYDGEVQLCAFDVLAMGGEDLRQIPLSMRKANLERLLRGRPDGIFINPFETGAIGPDLFRAACNRDWRGWCPSGVIDRIGDAGSLARTEECRDTEVRAAKQDDHAR